MDKYIELALNSPDVTDEIKQKIREGIEKSRKKIDSLILTKTHSTKNLISVLKWSNSFNKIQNYAKYIDYHPNIPNKEYWKYLAEAYKDSDNLYSFKPEIKKLFMANRNDKKYLMTSYENRKLKNLPNTFTIYRGMTEEEVVAGKIDPTQYGISWTLSEKVAEFFAYTYERNFSTAFREKTVVSLKVKKDKLVAYFSKRREQEVIYIP